MMIDKEVKIDWEPKELDYFLQKNYGYSLWHFSLSLASNIQGWIDYRTVKIQESGYRMLSWTAFWRKRINELQQLKKKNLDVLSELLNRKLPQIDKWEIPRALLEKKVSPRNKNYIEIMFDLNPFFKVTDDLIKRMEGYVNIQKVKGASYKRTNIIALIWHYFIRDESAIKTHIANITGLLEWFYDKFDNTNYYSPLNREIDEINNSKIKKVIYRYKHDKNKIHESLKNEVEYGKKVFEEYAVGSRIVLFENNNILIKYFSESNWEKFNSQYPALVVFPNREELKVEDFRENSAKGKVSFKNRAYKIFKLN